MVKTTTEPTGSPSDNGLIVRSNFSLCPSRNIAASILATKMNAKESEQRRKHQRRDDAFLFPSRAGGRDLYSP